jgi:hypothetical protein
MAIITHLSNAMHFMDGVKLSCPGFGGSHLFRTGPLNARSKHETRHLLVTLIAATLPLTAIEFQSFLVRGLSG